MAESNDVELKFWSEVQALSFMQLRKYVQTVGLELPKHVTKPSLYKLLGKEKKIKEDPVKENTSGASPSTIEVKKAASPRPTRANSAFNEADFLRGNKGNASKACKRFRSHFNQHQAGRLIRPIQNAIFVCDMTPDALVEAITKAQYKLLEIDFIQSLHHKLSEVILADWNAACSDTYDIEEDSDEKYQRFFCFVKIPQIRDRILILGELMAIQERLNTHHAFTHNVHQALYEIVHDPKKVRYLIAVLLFTRAKNTEQINLSQLKLHWDTEEDNSIILLRNLMRRLPVTAQDLWMAEKFDQIDESKPRIRKNNLGAIMKDHFEMKQKIKDGEEILETEVESTAEPVVLDALMSELTKKTTRIAPLNLNKTREAAQAKTEIKVDEHAMNLKRLEFRVPQYKIMGELLKLKAVQQRSALAGLTSTDDFIQELFVSYERLETTNEKNLELWKTAELGYFQALRTDYLKKISHPEFLVIVSVVEDDWDMFLPKTVWGAIWEFRAPFDKNVDLRFALEEYQSFLAKYGI